MAELIQFVAINEHGEEHRTETSRDLLKSYSELLLTEQDVDGEVQVEVSHDVSRIFFALLHEESENLISYLFGRDHRRAFNALKNLGCFINEWKIEGLSTQVADLMEEIINFALRKLENGLPSTLGWEDEHDVVKEILEYCDEENDDLWMNLPDASLVDALVDSAACIKGLWGSYFLWGCNEEDTRYVYEQFLDHLNKRHRKAEEAAREAGASAGDFTAVLKLVRNLT